MTNDQTPTKKRKYISQSDVPRVPLDEALRVPGALAEQYGKKPARPLDVASVLNMSPSSGTFRDLCGAAIGYGLTDGGPNASEISLTQLGLRVVAPLEEGDDERALQEAVLIPSVEKQFLERYDGSPLPTEKIGCNVLEQMGVPTSSAKRVFTLIVENAERVGFLKVIKDKRYVDLGNPGHVITPKRETSDGTIELLEVPYEPESSEPRPAGSTSEGSSPRPQVRNRKVFISHGKSRRVVDQLKELLVYGDFRARDFRRARNGV